MKTFFSFLFSRHLLALMALLIVGALIWFVGPLLAISGLRPLETVAVRVSVIIMLLVFLLALLSTLPMHVVGVSALCLSIWHGGPLLTIAETQPLNSAWVRASVIAVILFLYVAYWIVHFWKKAGSDEEFRASLFQRPKMEGPVLSEEAKKQLEDSKQSVKAMQGIVARSLTQIKSMRASIGKVRSLLEGNRYLYELPWYMVIGKPGTGKTSAVVNSGSKFPLAAQKEAAANSLALAGQGGTAHCDWWLTKEAVLIDTAGRYAMHEEAVKDQAEWISFLGLLRKHRPRAPINGAIVTVNMVDVIGQNDAQRLAYAAQLRERLVELRAELGIRFPVYVMVTKMDLLEGFNEYFQSLTSGERTQVWGFTLPYTNENAQRNRHKKSISTADQLSVEKQLNTELKKLTIRLEEGVAGRLLEVVDVDRRRSLFALPQQFAGLMAPLIKLIDELFDDAQFDNTEAQSSLRGVYFTSAAQSECNVPANPTTLPQRLMMAIRAKFANDATNFVVNNKPGMSTNDSHRQALMARLPKSTRSYFLSDLFTKIIIPEAHLVRPNLRWEFRFRLLKIICHAMAWVIFVWCAGGMMVSFAQNQNYLNSVTDKTVHLKQRVAAMFSANEANKMLMVPDTLSAAQELPLYRGLDLNNPSDTFRYGLYSAPPIADAAHQISAHLQDRFLLPEIMHRIEEVLAKSIADKNAKATYDTLRVYLQLHDNKHYDTDDVKAWVQHDWVSDDSATVFGSRSSMTNHVNHLFSGKRLVQSPSKKNDVLVAQARHFLGDNISTQRLYERAIAAMEQHAPQEFTLTRAVGPQAVAVFSRASGQPLDTGVPGIFTYDGYHHLFSKRLPEFVKLAQADDAWVMGHAENSVPISAQDLAKNSAKKKSTKLLDALIEDDPVTQEIRRLYLNDYALQWEYFLGDVRTVTGTMADSDLSVDLTVLRAFSASGSPLSRLAKAAAHETTLSRPLVANTNDDKSFLDKAADKISKKGLNKVQDLSGFSAQTQQEKELVDNHFGALREVVTGQVDAGKGQTPSASGATKSGLDNMTALINEYYTLLVVANTAMNADSLPPATFAAATKLKLEGDKLPAPFNHVLIALADSGTQKVEVGMATILSRQAQHQVDRINTMLAYQVTDSCKRGIEGRYPFAPNATQEVSIDDFARVFAAGGAADEFFKKQLAPFVDMSIRPWRYKSPRMVNPMTPAEVMATGLGSTVGSTAGAPHQGSVLSGPTFLSELLKLLAQQGPDPESFAKMQTIREAFFRELGGKTVSWKMDIKVTELDPTILELIMDFDGQIQRYSHGPVQALTVNWPGPRNGTMAELIATPRIRPDTSAVTATGTWALFRLLERGKLIPSTSGDGVAAVSFKFDDRQAVLEMNTGTLPNPLTSTMFKNFSCPGRR